MTRTARCHCGALEVECEGDPEQIFMCHCELCQRRTGTSYNLGAWFPAKDINVRGETKQYARQGDLGSEGRFYFCPTCGSNVYWEAPDMLPDMFGVAVGCFADPGFPRPTASLYGKRRHHWLTQPEGMPSLRGNQDSEPE